MGSRVPRYQEIAEELRHSIVSGELAVGRRLPPLRDLARTYRVTIPTVRQAVEVLTGEDLLRAEHGSGIYVTDTGARHEMLTSFSEGAAVAISVVDRTECLTDPGVAIALGLDTGAKLTRLTRLRILAGRRLLVQDSYLPFCYRETLDDYRDDEALYPFLRRRLGLVGVGATQRVTATVAGAREAAYLEVDVGHPVLASEKTSRAHDGTAFLHDRAFIDSTQMELVISHTGLWAEVAYQARSDAM